MSDVTRSRLLWLDAAVNAALGVLLITFHPAMVRALGVPETETAFYPRILGAVLLGIGLALAVEARRRHDGGPAGLGLVGAVASNLCGGLALASLLVLGDLDLPARGRLLLWGLVVVLVGVSAAELMAHRRH